VRSGIEEEALRVLRMLLSMNGSYFVRDFINEFLSHLRRL
jgi:hypothetical protein